MTEDQALELYDDMLDEYPVVIGNLTYDASRVLREIDPTAYRCGFNDFVDSLMEDGEEVEGYED